MKTTERSKPSTNGARESVAFIRLHSSRRSTNGKSCAECHSTPAAGGSSRRTVMRAGSILDGKYVGVANGGILHTSNYNASAMGATLYGSRVTLNLLGDGYVEVISDEVLQSIAREQASTSEQKIHGQIVYVTTTGNSSAKAVGRFGWKAQHATLLDHLRMHCCTKLECQTAYFQGTLAQGTMLRNGCTVRPTALQTTSMQWLNLSGVGSQLHPILCAIQRREPVQAPRYLIKLAVPFVTCELSKLLLRIRQSWALTSL